MIIGWNRIVSDSSGSHGSEISHNERRRCNKIYEWRQMPSAVVSGSDFKDQSPVAAVSHEASG